MIYAIDAADRIVRVDDTWFEFANQNDASDLTAEAVIGTSLWDHIGDKNTRTVYEMLLAVVRKSQKAVTFNLRCDSPDCRRFLQMEISPVENNLVSFKSQIVSEEPRDDRMGLLDALIDRSNEFVTICSWCNRMAILDEEWVEIDEGVKRLDLMKASRLPQLSHGICADCRVKWDREVAQLRAERVGVK